MESSCTHCIGSSLHSEKRLQEAEEGGEDCKVTAMESSCMNVCGTCAEPNFQVDDLLDFPSELEDELLGESSPGLFMNALPLHDTASSTGMSHVKFDDSAAAVEEPAYGLCVPPDELAHQLEWLSSFNEDFCFNGGETKLLSSRSSSSWASSGLAPMRTRKPRESFNSQSPVSVLEQSTHSYTRPCGINHGYKCHRVRKARTSRRVWSLDILKPILVDNRIKACYESSSLLVTSSFMVHSEPLCSFLKPDAFERLSKKMKHANVDADSGLIRRCTHCLVQKTPQWRAGPLGPKTLCNACGVRYKSGRLVPEYRPAASPSFVNEVHSNSHRRILEMRRAKEVELFVEVRQNKVESREEANGSESEGGSYVSTHGSCEESMGMRAGKAGGLSCREVLSCKKVEESGEGHSSADGGSDKAGPSMKGDSWREGKSGIDIEIDKSTSKGEIASVYNMEAMRQVKLPSESVGIDVERGTTASPPAEGLQCDSLPLEIHREELRI